MRHSIGFNWDHYSGMGEILSLREDGFPQATFLVGARRRGPRQASPNAPLLPSDMEMLHALADTEGWRVNPPESL